MDPEPYTIPNTSRDSYGNFCSVDGRNPAPDEVGSLSHYLQGFSTIPGGCLGFLRMGGWVGISLARQQTPC